MEEAHNVIHEHFTWEAFAEGLSDRLISSNHWMFTPSQSVVTAQDRNLTIFVLGRSKVRNFKHHRPKAQHAILAKPLCVKVSALAAKEYNIVVRFCCMSLCMHACKDMYMYVCVH